MDNSNKQDQYYLPKIQQYNIPTMKAPPPKPTTTQYTATSNRKSQ